jgi:signal transduction histidine kinase
MVASAIKQIVLLATIIFMMAPIALIIYAYVYNRAKRKHQQRMAILHRQELLKAKNEIQEQTLHYVSQEIHDNITQVLSFVKLNLATATPLGIEEKDIKIEESRKLVAQVINDLRNLSKSLNFEHFAQLGLVKTIQTETERYTRSGILKIGLEITGDTYPLGNQRELVLFRIFQEAINNAAKHARANVLNVSLQYSEQLFNLTIVDDGVGFLNDDRQINCSGLKNMQSRATLIGAVLSISSAPGKGCCIKVTIDPLLQQVYADGAYPNSTG